MRILLQGLDLLFLFLHVGVVLFLLGAWVWPPLRRAHRWLVLSTAVSWFAFGYWYGIGYCFLTDWHWSVLERMGRRDLPASFIKYAVDGMTGKDWDPTIIDVCTAGGFFFALGAAIWTGWRDGKNRASSPSGARPFLSWENTIMFASGLLALAAGATGIGRAIAWRWTADDAFISFRYALNWSRGLGPVFNAGERVEGYTNFLWTAILTPAARFGLDLEAAANLLGIACYVGLLLVVAFRGRYLARPDYVHDASAERRGGGLWEKCGGWIRLAPISWPALALHKHLSVYATSGLETQLFTLLITAGCLELLRARGSRANSAPPAFLAGMFLLTCACLTRPDGLLLYGIAALFVFRETYRSGARKPGDFVRPHLPFLLMYVPYWCARFAYYGLPWPNTFYAKSATHPYLSQGLAYLGLYFGSYWILPLLISIATAACIYRRRLPEMPVLIGLLAAGGWCFYVLFVGGDFMFARFLIPITPLLFLTGEGLSRRGFPGANAAPGAFSGPARALFAAFLVAFAVLLRYDPFAGRPLPLIAGVSEEHVVYSKTNRARLRAAAERLKPAVREANPVIAFYGSQAALVYYWDVERAVEAETGLTDEGIAALPLEQRGRIGHEKQASRSDLRQRGVDWSLRAPPRDREHARLRAAGIGDFEIICYRREVMEGLGPRSGFGFRRFPEYLDDYLAGKPRVDRARGDLPEFERLYFQCNEDPGRYRKMKRAAGMK